MDSLTTVELSKLEQLEDKIKNGLETFVEVGNALMEIRDGQLYREQFRTFEDYCRERWGLKRQRAYELMEAASVVNNLSEISDKLPTREFHTTPLAKLIPEQQREVWRETIKQSPNPTFSEIRRVVEEYKKVEIIPALTSKKLFYSVPDWNVLSQTQKDNVTSMLGDKQFNKQDSDNIEWARWSWNPITGCLHNCAYCYARDIANRFYPQGFEPVLIPDRLTAPSNTKLPDLDKFDNSIDKMGWRNVFTCSMADLFGKWIPQEWIEAVLEQVRNNPQWTFLFLTKFPIRMAEFEYPSNVWLGTSVDYQWAVERAEKAFTKIKASGFNGVCWLSCEPMMERLTFTTLDMFEWVVIGGSSKSTQTPEFKPPREWVNHLENQAYQVNAKVYEKTNLLERIREYPIT